VRLSEHGLAVRTRLLLRTGALISLLCASGARSQTPIPPDLRVLESASSLNDWAVQTVGSQRLLRFSTTVTNGGLGALHLIGTSTVSTNPDGSQVQDVMQRVFNTNATFTDRLAGRFTYHPTHGHMHIDGWTKYRLRIRPANQSVGSAVVESEYQSFCLLDLTHTNPALPGSPASAVYNSCATTTNGISVGWADTQGSGLASQSLDITLVPNGTYWLEAEADPRNNLAESNETNNVTRVGITLSGLPSVGFLVLSSTPSGAAASVPVSAVDFSFNQDVNGATFTSGDVTFTGPSGAIPVLSVSPISGTTGYRVSFAAQSTSGTYTMTIGPNINSLGGVLMDQNNNGIGGQSADSYTNTFTIPTLRVLSHTPTGSVAGPVTAVDVSFNKPIDASTFTLADIVSFTNGFSIIPVTGISFVSGSTYRVSFPSQAAICRNVTYTMVIGPDISDAAGGAMDQNMNGITGETADRYTASFSIAGTGPRIIGPNAAGYLATENASDSLPTLAAGGPGVINLSFSPSADDGAAPINLSTNTFRFYSTTYTGANQLYVSSNGLISFGAANTEYDNNVSALATNPAQAAIAVLWDDWITSPSTGPVLARFHDANGDLIFDWLMIQWTTVLHYQQTGTNTVTFRAALRINTGTTPGDVLLSYPDVDLANALYNFGLGATVGIKPTSASTTTNLVWSHNQAAITNGKAILFTTTPITVCIADTDNGTGTGTPDCGVGIEDLLYYLGQYDAGTTRADVDDGSGTGTPDGGVGIEDLLYYLSRYDAGC
jgi:hypothetical protein